MALLGVTHGPSVNRVLEQGSQDAYDGGCYRGISSGEYADSYEQFLQHHGTERPAIDRPETCDLLS